MAIVLDYGINGKAEVAVNNYWLEDCQNIGYKKIGSKSADSLTLDELQHEFYSENLDAEYLWFMKDSNSINFFEFARVLRHIEGKNISCILFNPFPDELEDQPEDLLIPMEKVDISKYLERFIAAGSVIVSRDMAEKMLALRVPEGLDAFWQFWAIMSVMANEHHDVYLCRDSLFTSNWAGKVNCAALDKVNLLDLWSRQWCTVLDLMPDTYRTEISALGNINGRSITPFGLYNIFSIRIEQKINISEMKCYEPYLDRAAPGTTKLIRWVLRIPRFLCKFLLKHKDSRVIRALRSLL